MLKYFCYKPEGFAFPIATSILASQILNITNHFKYYKITKMKHYLYSFRYVETEALSDNAPSLQPPNPVLYSQD